MTKMYGSTGVDFAACCSIEGKNTNPDINNFETVDDLIEQVGRYIDDRFGIKN